MDRSEPLRMDFTHECRDGGNVQPGEAYGVEHVGQAILDPDRPGAPGRGVTDLGDPLGEEPVARVAHQVGRVRNRHHQVLESPQPVAAPER